MFWKVKSAGEAMICIYGPTKIHKKEALLDPSPAARTLSRAKLPNIYGSYHFSSSGRKDHTPHPKLTGVHEQHHGCNIRAG